MGDDYIFIDVSRFFESLTRNNPASFPIEQFKTQISDRIEQNFRGKRFYVEVDEIKIDLKNQGEVYSTANLLKKGIFKRYDFLYQDYLYVVNIFIPYANLDEEYRGIYEATIQ